MRTHLSVTEGRWSLVDPATGFGIHNAEVAVQVNGDWLRSSAADRAEATAPGSGPGRLVLEYEARKVTVTVRFEPLADARHAGAHTVGVTLHNGGAETVTLGRCRVCDVSRAAGGRIALGAPLNDATFFRCTSSVARASVTKLPVTEETLSACTVGHVYNPAASVALNTSFLTFDRMLGTVELKTVEGPAIESYRCACDFNGYEIRGGQSVSAETLYVALSDDPHATLEAWADAVQAHYRPAIPETIPCGWLGWAWVDPIYGEPYAQVVERNARAIRRRLAGFDVEYVWVSIGNLADQLPGNWLKEDRSRFPEGVRGLAAGLAGRGFKLGLWIAPFWCCPDVEEQMEENRDNLVRDEDGTPVTSWPWSFTDKATEGPLTTNVLDGSHPNTIRYLTRIFEAYRELGVRYYMLDFLGSGLAEGSHHDRSMIAGLEPYRNVMKAIRGAAGEDTHLLSSSGLTFQNIQTVDAARIGNDFGEGRPLLPQFAQYPATFTLGNGADGFGWHCALANMAASWFSHKRFYLNDCNVLTVDKPVALAEARANATIFAISGSPIMLGDDIDRIDESRLALIKKCLPPGGDVALPVDLFTSCQPGSGPGVFRLRIARPWGAYTVLAVFNAEARAVTRRLTAADMGIDPRHTHAVYDFWGERYAGSITDALVCEVPASSVAVYRIAPRRPHPWLLSTDMHVLQGQVELEDLAWDDRSMTLSGAAVRPRGEAGNLILIVPEGFKPAEYRDLCVARDAGGNLMIIRKRITFHHERMRWETRFEPY